MLMNDDVFLLRETAIDMSCGACEVPIEKSVDKKDACLYA